MSKKDFTIMSRLETIQDLFKEWEKSGISLDEILKTDEIDELMTDWDKFKALAEAEKRVRRWVRKRGIRTDKPTLHTLSFRFLEKVFLEEVFRKVLSYYGITGSRVVDYTALSYKIIPLYHKYYGTALLEKVKELLKEYIAKRKLDEKVAKVLTLATLKALRYIELKYHDIIFEIGKEESETEVGGIFS